MRHVTKGNVSAHRYQVLAPLKNEAGIPCREQPHQSRSGDKGAAAVMEILSKLFEQQRQPENKYRSQRNQKAISERRQPIPIRITSYNIVKSCRAPANINRDYSALAVCGKQSENCQCQNRRSE